MCGSGMSELQLGWSGWAEELQGYVRPQETLKATEKEATVSGMFFKDVAEGVKDK